MKSNAVHGFQVVLSLVFCTFLSSNLLAATLPLVSHGDDWLYRKGTNEPPANWHTIADESLDESWLQGPGGFGYGDGDDATELTDMAGNYLTVYTRRTFTLEEDPPTNATLRLLVDFDDAYVAYLDGVEIARSDNVASTPHPYDSGVPTDSAASVDGGAVEITDLGPAADWLGAGPHILAVQGINGDAASSDMSLIVDLVLEEQIIIDPGNSLNGSLAEDQTLYASNEVYTVTADVTVEAGVTLTIEPGVTLAFQQGTAMTVLGRLMAEGTEEEPILFTRSPDATTWERILFRQAQASVFRHCTFEYADCEGDHKDYYDDDGDITTPPPSRTYFQAVVAIGTHLDFEHCLFHRLPNDSGGAQGDAIAIISDDPDYPGTASATIRHSEFLGIGQGIHTRFAHVLVEHCYFEGHNGDNDDIDLYGESFPPSLIMDNVFLDPNSDDAINPTRSSAVMLRNVIGHTGTSRQGDSGVVLRDRCNPVMMNNVIFNANSAGIDIQNTCDALLVNNTVINCGTGINFRDHTGRWGEPYFLTPGAASATLINNIIWDCSTSLNLVNSPSDNQPGSHATVRYCNIEGGQASANVSSMSTLDWGDGNIDANPQFTDPANNDYSLQSTSICIDAGTLVQETVTITNRSGLLTNLTITVTQDLLGFSRPRDGDLVGGAAVDIGAYEFRAPGADSNGDGVPDGWYDSFGLEPLDPLVGEGNPDDDPFSTYEEWVALTDPTDAQSYLRVESIELGPPLTIRYRSAVGRLYTLYYAPSAGTNTAGTVSWEPVTAHQDVPGTDDVESFEEPADQSEGYYQIGVSLP